MADSKNIRKAASIATKNFSSYNNLIDVVDDSDADYRPPSKDKGKSADHPSFTSEKPRASVEAIETLMASLKPIPFVLSEDDKQIPDDKKDILKRCKLDKFSSFTLETNIRVDLLSEFILNYDSANNCTHVKDTRIRVSKSSLAKSLRLPILVPKRDDAYDYPVLDRDVLPFCDYIYSFVSSRMILHGSAYAWTEDITRLVSAIVYGHPQDFDGASLMWSMMERELTQGDKLVECFYASHMQHLIRSECGEAIFEKERVVGKENPRHAEAVKGMDWEEGSEDLARMQIVDKLNKMIDSKTKELEQLKFQLSLAETSYSEYKKRYPSLDEDV